MTSTPAGAALANTVVLGNPVRDLEQDVAQLAQRLETNEATIDDLKQQSETDKATIDVLEQRLKTAEITIDFLVQQSFENEHTSRQETGTPARRSTMRDSQPVTTPRANSSTQQQTLPGSIARSEASALRTPQHGIPSHYSRTQTPSQRSGAPSVRATPATKRKHTDSETPSSTKRTRLSEHSQLQTPTPRSGASSVPSTPAALSPSTLSKFPPPPGWRADPLLERGEHDSPPYIYYLENQPRIMDMSQMKERYRNMTGKNEACDGCKASGRRQHCYMGDPKCAVCPTLGIPKGFRAYATHGKRNIWIDGCELRYFTNNSAEPPRSLAFSEPSPEYQDIDEILG